MTKRSSTAREHEPTRLIELVCVSRHARHGAVQKEPDKLMMVRGKWAWCPTGVRAGHDWQPVKAGSLNALRTQLVEVSRLVDVAMNNPGESTETRKTTNRPKSRAKTR